MIPLSWYLLLSAALFSIGLFGVLARRNAVAILMGVELMLNAVNINLIAFWRYLTPDRSVGLVWAVFVLTVAAAEAAVGLALIISVYRNRDSVIAEELDTLKN
ncbi:MAG: NADH-quinone oxidoreductase subunit NuoK [Candidatus Promineofilum sp.]|uniref:NADH-quinone oxidoreductase subunit NuoK n=1 Tax=Promineifilum sp. TaxID=2664178 RepID=UPI002411B878|nr:NADH-quinone oxidoreductase subunit NuoK [Promineifilum sp.]